MQCILTACLHGPQQHIIVLELHCASNLRSCELEGRDGEAKYVIDFQSFVIDLTYSLINETLRIPTTTTTTTKKKIKIKKGIKI